MKSLKIKLTTAFIMVAFAIAMLIVGIWAAETQTITMEGSVNFEIADKSLYMKDVRIQMDNNSDPTSIDDFMPGYINGDFKMNLGSLTNNYGSFALYFDIVNTIDEETQESFYYSPSVTCEQDGISAKVSGAIDKGTATADTVATADISGTIKLVVTNTTDTPVDLSKIKITIYQAEVYTDFVFDDHGTLLSYTGTDTNVTIPSSYAMIGEPTEMTLDIQNEDEFYNNMLTLLKMTNFTYIYNNQRIIFADFDEFYNYEFRFPCQLKCNDYNNVVFIENNDIPVTAIQGAFVMNFNVESIYIPEGVRKLGYGSFMECSSLINLSIPTSIEFLTTFGAIDGCENLNYYIDEQGVRYLGNEDNNFILLKDFGSFSGLSYIIPGTCKFIYDEAFTRSFDSLTIPQSVVYFGYYPSWGGGSVQKIIFEDPYNWVAFNTLIDMSNGLEILKINLSPDDLSDSTIAATIRQGGSQYYAEYWWTKY